MRVDTEVFIVGAGPAGMTLAAALSRHGVGFRIVDKDEGPIDTTRAPVLWQRTQEILSAFGIQNRWLPDSCEALEDTVQFYGKFTGESSPVAPNSPFPKALYAGQNITEHLLSEYLQEIGCGVEYGTEAVLYRTLSEDVCATTCRKGDAEEEIRSHWVVSAEGSQSTVREAAGIQFDGEKYAGYRIHLADLNTRWTFATPVGKAFFSIGEHWYMGGQRLPGHPDRFYFYILTRDESSEDQRNEITLESMQRLVRQLSGDEQAELYDPSYLNTSRYRIGLADSYRKGHVLLVGDAARVAPPLYAQGMNYAIQDAWNLAWKLAFVVNKLGPEELLNTYAAERRKVGEDLNTLVDRTFKFITEPKPLQATLARAVLPTMLSIQRFQQSFGQHLDQMDLDYSGAGFGQAVTKLGKLKSGVRAPALWAKRLPDCTLANLLDIYHRTNWTLLVIAPADRDAGAQALIEYATEKQRQFSATLSPVLLSQGPRRPEILPFETLVDAEGRFVREHHLPSHGLILVRPDGYIAWAGERLQGDLDSFLEHWLR